MIMKRKDDSLTSKIYHAGDLSIKNGKITFKPLTMETVVEKDEENPDYSKELGFGIAR